MPAWSKASSCGTRSTSGYLTVYAANASSKGGAKRGDKVVVAGRLGNIEVVDDEVRLGSPFIFKKDNLERLNF